MANHKPVATTATFCDGVKLNEAGDAIDSVVKPFTAATVNIEGLPQDATRAAFSTHFCVVIECSPGKHTKQMRFLNPRDEQLAIARLETVEIEAEMGGMVLTERRDLPVDPRLPGRYHLEVAVDGDLIVRVPLDVSFQGAPSSPN